MRGAHGDGQSINTRAADKVDSLIGVGQQLIMRQDALSAVAIFSLTHAAFQRAQNAQLALDRDAATMGHFGDTAGDVDIVLIAGWGLGILFQRAVHHH